MSTDEAVQEMRSIDNASHYIQAQANSGQGSYGLRAWSGNCEAMSAQGDRRVSVAAFGSPLRHTGVVQLNDKLVGQAIAAGVEEQRLEILSRALAWLAKRRRNVAASAAADAQRVLEALR